MSNLTFQEKMLWIQLAGFGVLGFLYVHVTEHSRPGHHYFHAVVLVLLLLFGLVRLFVRRRAGVLEDERDRAVASLGDRWSNLILWTGLVLILVFYWDHGNIHSAEFLIGLLFHLLLFAGVARIVRELVAYRQAA